MLGPRKRRGIGLVRAGGAAADAWVVNRRRAQVCPARRLSRPGVGGWEKEFGAEGLVTQAMTWVNETLLGAC